jgi:hypothetical protein
VEFSAKEGSPMLSDGTLRGLKPQASLYKAADRDGLYLVVTPRGTISFRMDYRLNGRRETLTKAHAEGRLEEKLKLYTAPPLLVVDEIGYLPIDRVGANLFFQLISRRYERGPMILTSNQSFGAWGEVFGDRVIATAILDRLLHHAVTMNIRGNSYRLKDKLKAGLVRSHDDNSSQPGGEI